MQTWGGISLLLLCNSVTLACSEPLVIHEKRSFGLPSTLAAGRRRIEPETILPMRIGLKQNQQALDKAENWLMDVSDPDSANFGRHWSQDAVLAAFQPSAESVLAVKDWLHSHGVTEFTHSDNKQWLAFDIITSKAEEMLEAEYYEHEVTRKDGRIVGYEASCDQYHLPDHLTEHIDFIKPGIQGIDITGHTTRSRDYLHAMASDDLEKRFSCPLSGGLEIDGHKTRIYAKKKLPPNAPCSEQVTPACVRALYGIPLADPNSKVSPDNTLGVFEDTELYYQGTLDLFNERFTDIPAGYAPIFKPIATDAHPPTAPHQRYWKIVAGEGPTDLEAAIPIIYPQNATAFYLNRYTGSWSEFLDAIDGSYCLPTQQEGKRKCGIFEPTNVITFSFGDSESAWSHFWLKRQCMEYLKLGLQGVSLFMSTGDDGVEGTCNDKSKFEPGFPASCPWVTAVGATEIGKDRSVYETEVAASQYNHAESDSPEESFASGGGFSIQFDRPKYQQRAVLRYFETSEPPWPYFENGDRNSSGRYNRNGRGYPDVAANGKRFALCGWNLCKQLNCSRSAGTSISTPLFAGIINRIIEERIKVGKGPLGFLNPTLYKHSEALNDVIEGGNGDCTAAGGFLAAPGWDPVTGLGTPNYPRLLETFMELP